MGNGTAYLGPEFSFCEEAARRYTGYLSCAMKACQSIEAVFAAVDAGEADQGIVPIENSCEGSVNQTLDLLAYGYELKITGEIIIPVEQNLLVKVDTPLHEITHILSHPQALAQCRGTMLNLCPWVSFREVSSTAEAARMVRDSENPWGAVASQAAAAHYGLHMLKQNTHDAHYNETRFIVIGRENSEPESACKSSFIIHTLHQPGALYRCLEEFYRRGVNLTKIESRPARTRIGEYLFFIDVDGALEQPKVTEAVQALQQSAQEIRFLGSYSVH
ncbi:MAG: prephenate dehydratase [Thermodesulfobacteriota bacterium]|nr:prephenate dehydratase [Thermodesulfobacteriota bacterium]